MDHAVMSTKQGLCFICKKKILRRYWIRKLVGGWAHETCYQKVKPRT